jgi:enamine deaminase RidA (YjgF/YER057c/UK114 family)
MTTEDVVARLAARGFELPVPPPPAGSYAPVRIHGGTGYLSAQFPFLGGRPAFTGAVGEERSLDEGRRAAEIAALNALSRMREGLGGFERLACLLRVDGHVASAPGFNDQPRVLDGASDLFIAALGEQGVHARTAFSPARLPWDLTVMLVVTFAVVEAKNRF